MYHSIQERDLDPWGLCVSPDHFSQHLEILAKQRFQFLSVERLVDNLASWPTSDPVVVITQRPSASKPLLDRRLAIASRKGR